MKKEIRLAGVCGVDAGMILIGDPCYGQDQQAHPSNKNWEEFCQDLQEARLQYPMTQQLYYDKGHEGLGVVMDSGFGDGVYPVYVTIEDFGPWGKRISKAEIFFDKDPYAKGETDA